MAKANLLLALCVFCTVCTVGCGPVVRVRFAPMEPGVYILAEDIVTVILIPDPATRVREFWDRCIWTREHIAVDPDSWKEIMAWLKKHNAPLYYVPP